MRTSILAAAAVLSLSACADAIGPAQQRSADGSQPLLAPFYIPKDSIYTTQTPSEYLDASPGWQVATRFIPDYDGKITGFRFYKAPGETGTHTARLYNEFGTQLAYATFSNETSSGWQRVTVSNEYVYAGNTYYITVNTNVKQAKTFAYFTNNGYINRNWGSAIGGAYGSLINCPTTTDSGSSFFVDVYFRAVLCDDVVTENCV